MEALRVAAHASWICLIIALAITAAVLHVPRRWLLVSALCLIAGWFSGLIISTRNTGIIDRSAIVAYLATLEIVSLLLVWVWLFLLLLEVIHVGDRKETHVPKSESTRITKIK